VGDSDRIVFLSWFKRHLFAKHVQTGNIVHTHIVEQFFYLVKVLVEQ
jgi:hypothetical protein